MSNDKIQTFEVIIAWRDKHAVGFAIEIKQTKSYMDYKLRRFSDEGFTGAFYLGCLETGSTTVINLEDCYAIEVNIKEDEPNPIVIDTDK